jgi:hypothetical protein
VPLFLCSEISVACKRGAFPKAVVSLCLPVSFAVRVSGTFYAGKKGPHLGQQRALHSGQHFRHMVRTVFTLSQTGLVFLWCKQPKGLL